MATGFSSAGPLAGGASSLIGTVIVLSRGCLAVLRNCSIPIQLVIHWAIWNGGIVVLPLPSHCLEEASSTSQEDLHLWLLTSPAGIRKTFLCDWSCSNLEPVTGAPGALQGSGAKLQGL